MLSPATPRQPNSLGPLRPNLPRQLRTATQSTPPLLSLTAGIRMSAGVTSVYVPDSISLSHTPLLPSLLLTLPPEPINSLQSTSQGSPRSPPRNPSSSPRITLPSRRIDPRSRQPPEPFLAGFCHRRCAFSLSVTANGFAFYVVFPSSSPRTCRAVIAVAA